MQGSKKMLARLIYSLLALLSIKKYGIQVGQLLHPVKNFPLQNLEQR